MSFKQPCGCRLAADTFTKPIELCGKHYLVICGACYAYKRLNKSPTDPRIVRGNGCYDCIAFLCQNCKSKTTRCAKCFTNYIFACDEVYNIIDGHTEENAIPRPGTGFALFCQKVVPSAGHVLNRLWNNLSAVTQEQYNKAADSGLHKL